MASEMKECKPKDVTDSAGEQEEEEFSVEKVRDRNEHLLKSEGYSGLSEDRKAREASTDSAGEQVEEEFSVEKVRDRNEHLLKSEGYSGLSEDRKAREASTDSAGEQVEEEFSVENVLDRNEHLLKSEGYSGLSEDREASNEKPEEDQRPSSSSGTAKRKPSSNHGEKNATKKTKKPSEDGNKLRGFDRGLEPDKILAATEVFGVLMFLIKWKGTNEADYVPAFLANAKCPQTVIKYYEKHLKWPSSTDNNADNS